MEKVMRCWKRWSFGGLAFLALGFFQGRGVAADAPDLFKQGNASYAAGKYADAATAYESAGKQGLRHWILSYNLGAAYYRAGQLGKAILHFERAFRLNPGDSDVIDNLALTSSKSGDPRVPVSALPALAWRLFYAPGINAMTVIASLLFLVVSGGLMLWLYGGRALPSSALQLMGAVLLLLIAWIGARVYVMERPLGVVTAPVAEVRSGPNLSYPANFTVPEGRRVVILEEVEPVSGWLEIGVPQEGLKGWVPDTAVERI